MRSEPVGSGWDDDPPALDRIFGRFRAAICGSTLLMVGLSWPLWVDDPDFPRVPFVDGLPEIPAWASRVDFVGIVATLGLATIGFRWRAMIAISLPLLIFAILRDQNRFQPWAYQYALIGLAMACASRAEALRLARWYVFGLYFYSGLSKLDTSFCRELGPTFLATALGPIGLHPMGWPDSARTLACLAMPAFEVAVAWLLIVPRTRRVGLIAAVAQHLALIGILGPWGLGHSTIVLVWNAGLIVEDIILFGRTTIPVGIETGTRFGALARLTFWSAMILPVGERLGLSDAWPGHALYASHAERSEIFIHEDDVDRYPEAIRRRLGPAGLTPWRRLDLTGWSRDVRGTPIYPSRRVGSGLAEFLEARYSGTQPIRLVQWGRARPWNGARARQESVGLAAIRKWGEGCLLNTHPGPSDPR
jgi:hypothetical protein